MNENEFRLQEEELKIKQSADQVMLEMQKTNKELDQLSQGLQQELQ